MQLDGWRVRGVDGDRVNSASDALMYAIARLDLLAHAEQQLAQARQENAVLRARLDEHEPEPASPATTQEP